MAKNKVVIPIEGDDKGFRKKLKGLESTAIKGAKAIAKSFVAVSGALVAAGGYAINLASDLEEVQNVVDVTFGKKGAAKIETWAKEAKNAFGMSELQAKQFSGTLGAMVKSMGLSDDAVYDMSTELVQLAGDFASFYNLDHETAFEKIRSGISGETEPLKQLGINMSVANLEAFALSQGITKAYNSMTQAEQATLRYNYLMSAGKDAQGDFARTADSLANQLRTAKLELDELAASAGGVLIPIASDALSVLSDLTGQLKEGFDTGGIEGLVESLGDVAAQFVSELADRAPDMLDAAGDLIESFADGLVDNSDEIAEAAVDITESLVEAFGDAAPKVVGAVGKIGKSIAKELGEAYPILKPLTGTVELLADNIDLCTAAYVSFKAVHAGGEILTSLKGGFAKAAAEGAKYAATTSAASGKLSGLWNIAKAFLTKIPKGGIWAAIGGASLAWLVKTYKEIQYPQNKALEAWEKEKAALQSERAEIVQNIEEWNNYISAQKEEEAAINSQMSHIQRLSEDLRTLCDENGNVAESDKHRAQFILGELNDALGTEYTMTGNQINQYRQLSTEVDNLIAKKRAEALLNSKQDEYEKATGEYDSKKSAMDTAQSNYNIASTEVSVLTTQIENQRKTIAEAEQAIREYWEYVDEHGFEGAPVLQYTMDDVREMERSLGSMSEQLGIAKERQSEYSDTLDKTTKEFDEVNGVIVDYEDTYKNILAGNYDAVFKSSYSTAQGSVDGTSAALSEGLIQIEGESEEGGKTVSERFSDALSYIVPNTQKSMSQLAGVLSTSLDMPIENMSMQGEKLIATLTDGTQIAIDGAVTQAAEDGKLIVDAYKISEAVINQVGVYYIEGIANGVISRKDYLLQTMQSIATEGHKYFALKGWDEHSPSKLSYKAGVWYIEGAENGVIDESENLNDIMENAATKANDSFADKLSQGMNTIRSEIASITGLIKEEAEKNVKAFDAELDAIDRLRDFGIDDEETYYKKLEFLRDNYLTKNSDKWIEVTKELYDYQESQLEEHKDNIEDVYDDIADHISDKLDEVAKKQQKFSENLTDSTELFQKYTIDGVVHYKLNDFSSDNANLAVYQQWLSKAMERVKSSGASEDAISGVLDYIDGLAGDEAGMDALIALASASDADFSKFMSGYAQNLSKADGIAAQRYSDDMVTAAEESDQQMVDELTKAGLEIPEGFFVSGTLSAQQFGEAFMTEIELQMQEIQKKLTEFNAKINASISSAPGNVNQDNRSTTYHIYGDNSNNTVKQIQNMETIKRLSGQ